MGYGDFEVCDIKTCGRGDNIIVVSWDRGCPERGGPGCPLPLQGRSPSDHLQGLQTQEFPTLMTCKAFF